ncbi:MAG TPA: vanadium-dependent haloperoxidase [Burkholderiaceae bacterium]|nr:vanadium-dependent haloperoxidase [Burkholderiaceae bacterium]
MLSYRTLLCVALAAGLACGAGAVRADAVTDWNANAAAAAVAACIVPGENPLHESRLYAMAHLAAHDALNAIHRKARPYAYSGRASAVASPEAAVAAAVHDVLISQIPLSGVPAECVAAGKARVEADYAKALAEMPDGTAKAQGMAVGQAAAGAIIALRANDGSDRPLVDAQFPQGTEPGQWRFTPGSPPIAFAPDWGRVKPFALREATQFMPGSPLKVSCDSAAQGECLKYATDLEEVRRLGSDGVSAPSARTTVQTEIALFWLESSPTAWNRIARGASASRRLDLWHNARLFALLNVAQADGYIASWATKYHYRFWRPITAIRTADNDGNPHTASDAAWMSLRPTPPVPDYESAHAVEGAAAAEVLRHVFGPHHPFETCSMSLPAGSRCGDGNAVLRKFHSFDDAAAENGDSRVLIGFHFRDAVNKGLKRGRLVGHWAIEQVLQPQ